MKRKEVLPFLFSAAIIINGVILTGCNRRPSDAEFDEQKELNINLTEENKDIINESIIIKKNNKTTQTAEKVIGFNSIIPEKITINGIEISEEEYEALKNKEITQEELLNIKINTAKKENENIQKETKKENANDLDEQVIKNINEIDLNNCFEMRLPDGQIIYVSNDYNPSFVDNWQTLVTKDYRISLNGNNGDVMRDDDGNAIEKYDDDGSFSGYIYNKESLINAYLDLNFEIIKQVNKSNISNYVSQDSYSDKYQVFSEIFKASYALSKIEPIKEIIGNVECLKVNYQDNTYYYAYDKDAKILVQIINCDKEAIKLLKINTCYDDTRNYFRNFYPTYNLTTVGENLDKTYKKIF